MIGTRVLVVLANPQQYIRGVLQSRDASGVVINDGKNIFYPMARVVEVRYEGEVYR